MSRLSARIAALALLPLLVCVGGGRAAAQSHILVVSGLGGEKEYSDTYYDWGAGMVDAALKLGVPRADVVFLAEDSVRDPQRINGRSTKENIQRAITQFAERGHEGDVVLILLIGHGSMQAEESLFSIPGPDLKATDFDTMLNALAKMKVAFVNASSSSGDFVSALSGPGRVVITATRTGFERNEAMFGRFFVRAFAADGADTDKDNRVSILEAYQYARLETARVYEADKRILTEHAQLDDNADGKGSLVPDPRAGDGMLARGMFLSQRLTSGTNTDPRLPALYKERQDLEDKIDALRRRKATMPPAEYETALEQLIVDLATKTAEIKKLEGGGR
jgi:hypothetical protein